MNVTVLIYAILHNYAGTYDGQTYDAGDKVHVIFNTSTQEFSVDLYDSTGALKGSPDDGPNLDAFRSYQLVTQEPFYSFCSGTTLNYVVDVPNAWPYAELQSTPNHYTCVIEAIVCDLEISSVVDLVAASSPTSNDGSLTVSATSTAGGSNVINNGAFETELAPSISIGSGNAWSWSGAFSGCAFNELPSSLSPTARLRIPYNTVGGVTYTFELSTRANDGGGGAGNYTDWKLYLTDGVDFSNVVTESNKPLGTSIFTITITPNADFPYIEITAESNNVNGQDREVLLLLIEKTSSNGGVKFSLTDFDYQTGGQTSGLFSSLYPGVYTIYARDANGCFDTFSVRVPVTNVYGVYYRLEFDDINNYAQHKIDILKRGFSGSVTEICGADVPIRISYNGSGEGKYSPLVGSSAVVGLMSESNQQFSELFLGDDRQFQVRYYRDNEIRWIGYIIPSMYEEPYIAPPYPVFFTATDGIGDLKNFDLLNDVDERYREDVSQMFLIKEVLNKLNLGIDIHSGVNLYETTMDQADSDDPLPQTYVNTDAYYGEEPQEEPLDCDTVLQAILKPYGARLFQAYGVWWIVRTQEMSGIQSSAYIILPSSWVNTFAATPLTASGDDFTAAITSGSNWGADQPLQIEIPSGATLEFDVIIEVTGTWTGSISFAFAINKEGGGGSETGIDSFNITANQGATTRTISILKTSAQLDECLQIFISGTSSGTANITITMPVGESIYIPPINFNYRIFDSDGVYQSNSNFEPAKDFSSGSDIDRAVPRDRAGLLMIIPGYGKISLTQELGLKNNLLKSGEFEEDDLVPTGIGSQMFFREWTIELNAEGLTYGLERVTNGDSRGAFYMDFLNASDNDYNLLKATLFEIEASPADKMKFSFQYLVRPSIQAEWVRFGFKLIATGGPSTTLYYNASAEFNTPITTPWQAGDVLNEIYADKYGEWVKLEFPMKAVEGATHVELRFYLQANNRADYTDINDLPNTLPFGTKRTVLRVINTGAHISYYTYTDTLEDEDLPNIVVPSGGGGAWKLDNTIQFTNDFSILNSILIDNAVIGYLPDGEDPDEQNILTYLNAEAIKTNYDENLFHGDLGDVSNGQNIYNNYLRLSDGTPTALWSGSKPILQVLIEDYTAQMKVPNYRIQSPIFYDIDITFLTIFEDQFDGGRKYIQNFLDCDVKNNTANVEMIELKDVTDDTNAAFSNAYSNAYDSEN